MSAVVAIDRHRYSAGRSGESAMRNDGFDTRFPLRVLRETDGMSDPERTVYWMERLENAHYRGRGDTLGAAQINLGGRSVIVARMVCEEVNGPPPTPAHQAAHSCGKGHLGCITPQHLRWATQVENEADKLIHGTHNRYRYAAIRQARMSSHG